MAYTKLAIVRGEWQLDRDHTFRLYVRPTIEIIDRAGETHHVSAFATTDRRSNESHDATSGTLLYSTANSGGAFGGTDRSAFLSEDGQWLEPQLTPTHSFHTLGELNDNCSPIMATLILRSAVQWLTDDMEPDLVCIDEAVGTNQFDVLLIDQLKRLKV